jgi:hypothetical protein
MAESKKDIERARIQEEFDKIQLESNSEYDLTTHLASSFDLPNLGEISLYDYDVDIVDSTNKSMEVLESMVDLYFSDLPQLKEHPYLKNKMKEDAAVYAETIFLSKMTRKNFISIMKQIDTGDNSARMYDVVNKTVSEIRENAKFISSQRSELEKFYKQLRDDMEDYDIGKIKKQIDKGSKDDSKAGAKIADNTSMNELIKKALEAKKEKDGEK